MPPLTRVLERLHALAWRGGLDVLPVPAESRGLRGMAEEDVFRLHGVLQRALAQAAPEAGGRAPEWAGLVAEALHLAERGQPPRSQFLQDVWVLRASEHRRDGFFVEVGAGDGLFLSNTWLLETEYGWRGALCEPNPRSAAAVRALRRERAVLLEHAVARASGLTVHLVDSAERSRVTSGPAAATVPVTTVTPAEVLERSSAPDVVDYLSVDTEGSEPEILRAWPWDRHHVRLLTVEHNHVPGRMEELDGLLLPRGYRRVLAGWSSVDAWYVHADEPGAATA